MKGSLWRVKMHANVSTFNEHGDMFRLPPGELVVVGDGMLQGDMLGWASHSIRPFDRKLVNAHRWVKVLLPHQGWMNRTYFNRDSIWLERIA